MAILSRRCKPDYFESHKSLKLSFTSIWSFCLTFVESESFLEWNSPDIPALCETNLDDSIDSGNFSVSGYFPSVQEDSVTHMHCLMHGHIHTQYPYLYAYSYAWSYAWTYVKGGFPMAQDLSWENFANSYLCFRLALLRPVSHFFFLCWLFSLSSCTVFHAISSNIDELLSINLSAYMFVFWDETEIRTDWVGLSDHLRDVPWEDIFELIVFAASSEFCEGFRLELMYISLIVNGRSSLIYFYGFQKLVLLS